MLITFGLVLVPVTSIMLQFYTYRLILYNCNNLNISIHGNVPSLPVARTGACTPLYLRLPKDGASAPKRTSYINLTYS